MSRISFPSPMNEHKTVKQHLATYMKYEDEERKKNIMIQSVISLCNEENN